VPANTRDSSVCTLLATADVLQPSMHSYKLCTMLYGVQIAICCYKVNMITSAWALAHKQQQKLSKQFGFRNYLTLCVCRINK